MSELLNDLQLLIIIKNDSLFDGITPLLNDDLQKALADFQIRAGNTYNEGVWTVPATGTSFINPDCPKPPTLDEASRLLGEAYAGLADKSPLKSSLRILMSELGLPPRMTQAKARKGAQPLSKGL